MHFWKSWKLHDVIIYSDERLVLHHWVMVQNHHYLLRNCRRQMCVLSKRHRNKFNVWRLSDGFFWNGTLHNVKCSAYMVTRIWQICDQFFLICWKKDAYNSLKVGSGAETSITSPSVSSTGSSQGCMPWLCSRSTGDDFGKVDKRKAKRGSELGKHEAHPWWVDLLQTKSASVYVCPCSHDTCNTTFYFDAFPHC